MRTLSILFLIFSLLGFTSCIEDGTFGSDDRLPVLESILPSSGKAGDTVLIEGNQLAEVDSVYLNGAISNLISVNSTSLLVVVPVAASSGPISASNQFGLSLGPEFTVLPDSLLLRIDFIDPTSGQVPIDVTVTGQNFGTNKDDLEVSINGQVVVIEAVSNTEMSIIIPENAQTGTVSVKKISKNEEAIGPVFTVLPPDPIITVSTFAITNGNDNFGAPFQIVSDGDGGFYYSDPVSHRIKKVNSAGIISNYAGSGQAGFSDGLGSQASFNAPSGITIDASGNLYIADLGNHRIRKVEVGGLVTTVAGIGKPGFADGVALQQAEFNQPVDVAVNGNLLFISDFQNHAIRQLNMTTGIVSTLTGNGTLGFVNGSLNAARFAGPIGLSLDGNNNILVADGVNHSIRLINRSSGQVSTVAGTGTSGFTNGTNANAQFNLPYDVGTDANGVIYVADRTNHSIRKIDAGVTTTFAGTGVTGFTDGDAEVAQFANPLGLVVASPSELLICDFSNGRIRKITIE